MRFVFCFFIMLIFLPPPVRAQMFDVDGKKIMGEGPKGRYSKAQVRPLATKIIPGRLLFKGEIENAGEAFWQNGDLFYEYRVLTKDGSIYELEFYARDASLYEVEVERLSNRPLLPPRLFDVETAKILALKQVERHGRGKMKVEYVGIKLGVFNRKLVYTIQVKKFMRVYDVVITASSGKILSMKET